MKKKSIIKQKIENNGGSIIKSIEKWPKIKTTKIHKKIKKYRIEGTSIQNHLQNIRLIIGTLISYCIARNIYDNKLM